MMIIFIRSRMEWNETADKHGNVSINPAGSRDHIGTFVSLTRLQRFLYVNRTSILEFNSSCK